jgi:site-specific recombinase
MFSRLKRWISRWRESADPHVGLDALLSHADPGASAEARLNWLADLMRWVLADHTAEGGERAGVQAKRVQHLFNVLERNPEWKRNAAATVRAILAESEGTELLAEAGLPNHFGFFGELTDRLLARILPEAPRSGELGGLLLYLLPERGDANKLESLGEEAYRQILDLPAFGMADADSDYAAQIKAGMRMAAMQLATQVCAAGMQSGVHKRIALGRGERSPFLYLPGDADDFLDALDAGADPTLAEDRLRTRIAECQIATDSAYTHLDEFGVSIAIVYQLERIGAQLQRLSELATLIAHPDRAPTLLPWFLGNLVRDIHDRRSIGALIRENFRLAARKVVERNAETGEHYITHDRAEYASMARSAGGGGVLTAFTVYMKFAIVALPIAPFFEGLAASLNYAVSFVAIQLCGFTLATKQPAMTAPALASRMRDLAQGARLEGLVDEIADLVRSQVAAILGNLAAVAPVALVIGLLLVWIGGLAVPPEKAKESIASLSILGPSFVFAAFTGVLLWLSSLMASWADNWFAYRRLGPAVAAHRRLIFVFGPSGALRIGRFLEHNVAGFAGNVGLGFLLGMLPTVLHFFGIPLEARHVTLSTGQLFASVAVLGWGVCLSAGFWLAVAGIAMIGLLNLGVSFALALWVALRARGIDAPTQSALNAALFRRLRQEPMSFLFPKRAAPSAPA